MSVSLFTYCNIAEDDGHIAVYKDRNFINRKILPPQTQASVGVKENTFHCNKVGSF